MGQTPPSAEVRTPKNPGIARRRGLIIGIAVHGRFCLAESGAQQPTAKSQASEFRIGINVSPFPIWLPVAVVAAVLLIGLILIYNRLVRARAQVQEGWSGIKVQLRRRADLVPNLVTTVEGYVAHERGLLNEVTALRGETLKAANPGDAAQADAALGGVLGRLLVVAEAYPDLKADANFRSLQDELAEVETELQSARRYYNATVRDLNTRIASFPDMLIARPLGFQTAPFFQDDDPTIEKAPVVRFGAKPAA
jgi:LemA protein